MLSCSSRWQPPQRRQLPAVSSHINPGGEIRAKWLLLRGDGFDSHGQSQQHVWLSETTLSQPQMPLCRPPPLCPCLYRFWNHRAVRRLRGLPTHVSHRMSIFHAHAPRGGHKYCYLHFIRQCYTARESLFVPGEMTTGFKSGDSGGDLNPFIWICLTHFSFIIRFSYRKLMNNSTWLFSSPTEQGTLAGRHSVWTGVPHLHNSDIPGKLSINQILKIKVFRGT